VITAVCEPDAAPNMMPPEVGRTTVCTKSLMWSTTGILSAKNSTVSRPVKMPIIHGFSIQFQLSGRVMTSVKRERTPTSTNGI
jgi:hypothetical protein